MRFSIAEWLVIHLDLDLDLALGLLPCAQRRGGLRRGAFDVAFARHPREGGDPATLVVRQASSTDMRLNFFAYPLDKPLSNSRFGDSH